MSKRTARGPGGVGSAGKMTPQSASEPLLALLKRFSGVTAAVAGDLVLDEFAYGDIARVSREAPVLILEYKTSRYAPGGGANTAANIAALGANVRIVGRVGRDEAGRRLLALFEERRIDRSGIVRDPAHLTPVKTRILAGSAHTIKQQIVRIDRNVASRPPGRSVVAALARGLARAARGAQALLIADYGFGAATPALAAALRPRPPILTLDSRFRLLEYRGVTAATPNLDEVEKALGIVIPDGDDAALSAAGRRLRRKLGCEALLVTQGSRGMTLFQEGASAMHIPPFGADEVADVTGAGDTVIGTFTLALAAGASYIDAAAMANVAGGLVVMKHGTATVAVGEIARTLRAGTPPLPLPRKVAPSLL